MTNLESRLKETTSKYDTTQSELDASKAKIAKLETQATEQEGEVISSLKSNHALEISDKTAKIRNLEQELHDAQTKIHSLSRQVSELNESKASPMASPDHRYRPIGLDAFLPVHVRQKRQVSLTALKARMQPKRLGSNLGVPRDSPITPVEEKNGLSRQAQFGEEIVSCCPACQGDLISL